MPNEIQMDQEPRLAEIVTGILNDAQELVKQQLALFKAEIREDVRKTRDAAIPLICGIMAGGLAVIVLALAVVHLLAWAWPAMPLWCCYGLVGAVLAATGAVLFQLGKARFDSFNLLPEKSAEAMKENVQWFKNPK